ncbi:MAG: signal recognition particle protein [bacterium]
MLFQGLAEKLQNTFRKLRGHGKLSEADINAAMREVRLALLEADVSLAVTKDFVNKIKERALGQEVMQSLTPAQQVIKIVHAEITALLGGTQSKIAVAPKPPTVIMLVGLQGSGKTTTAGKLALHLRKQNKRPLLAAADVYRPAAVQQLTVLGKQISIPVFAMGTDVPPPDIAKGAVEHARTHGEDTIIIDTAGRLHIDEGLMEELVEIKAAVGPHEILLVVDAMTGQDAVRMASDFDAKLGIDGLIMTKLDGDMRGGAALSVKSATGKPIKFAGMGEKIEALEPFYPERMASRILGMGDVLTLIEKAQANYDLDKAKEMERKLRTDEFTFEDFLAQLDQVRSLGPLDEVLGMVPGFAKLKPVQGAAIDEKELKRTEAIICSMTPEERRNPALLNGSRRRRIAKGSGTSIQDVNRLINQFEGMRKMMKQFGGMARKGKGKNFAKLPFFK